MYWYVEPNDSQGAVEQFEACLSICQKRTAFSVVLCMDVASEVFPGTMSLLFALSALCPAFLAHTFLQLCAPRPIPDSHLQFCESLYHSQSKQIT